MKLSLIAILSFVTIGIIKAQTTPSTSLLWEVSGNGLQKPSYLFGTFHIMCKENFEISPALKKAFSQTDQLFEEMKMDDPSIQLKMMTLMVSTTSLKELLGEEVYEKTATEFQKITGMPLLLFNKMKPFAAISLLTQKSITCSETVMPEMEFIKLAKEANKEVLGLETVEDEMKAIDKISLDSQITSLKRMVQNFDSTKIMMQLMEKEYQKRDPEALEKMMRENGASGDFETALLTERNKAWIFVIEKAMQAKPSFFAFGAGHLGGQTGVLNLLKQKGYILKPIAY